MSLSVLSTPGSPSRSPSRIPEVDGLRGLAIVLVMLWHYVAIVVEPPRHSVAAYAVSSLRLAWSGVDLFFVLSGFLIGGILIDERTSPRYLANFYRRRFFRIVPLYALVCGLFWAAVLLGGAKRYGVAGHWLFGDPLPWYSFPLFVQNAFIAIRGTFDPMPTGVTWSLAIEEQFYLTLPLLVRHLSRRRLVQVLATAALAAPVLRGAAFYLLPHGGYAAYALTPMRADALIAGVFGAMIVRSPAGRAFLERRRRALASAACGLGAGLLALIPLRQVDLTGSVVMCTVGYSALAAFYALVLLLAVSRPSSPVARCLRAGWLRSTGEIAYGMYMLHEVVLGLCFAFFLRAAPVVTNRVEFMVVPLAAMLTVAVARLSWTHFESKMLRFGRRRSDTVPPEPVAVDRPTPSVPSLALIPSVEGVAPSGPK